MDMQGGEGGTRTGDTRGHLGTSGGGHSGVWPYLRWGKGRAWSQAGWAWPSQSSAHRRWWAEPGGPSPSGSTAVTVPKVTCSRSPPRHGGPRPGHGVRDPLTEPPGGGDTPRGTPGLGVAPEGSPEGIGDTPQHWGPPDSPGGAELWGEGRRHWGLPWGGGGTGGGVSTAPSKPQNSSQNTQNPPKTSPKNEPPIELPGAPNKPPKSPPQRPPNNSPK